MHIGSGIDRGAAKLANADVTVCHERARPRTQHKLVR